MLNIWARVSVVILYTDNSQRFFFRKFSYLCLYEGSDDKKNDKYRTDIDDFIAWQWDSQLCLIYTSESRKKIWTGIWSLQNEIDWEQWRMIM